MKLAFDLSSLLWTCLSVGKDPEGAEIEHNEKKVWVNGANYGYENIINAMTSAMKQFNLTPMNCILVPEGMNSKSRRLMIDNTYKSGRGSRPPEAYTEFNNLKERIVTLWRSLGSLVLIQHNVEADDTLGWLADNTRENLVIITNDNDIAVLNKTNQSGAVVQVRVGGVLGENKYGPFQFKYLTLYKSLVGDSSDSVSGIKGFGPAAWLTLHSRFGDSGLDELIRLAELGSLLELESEAETDPFIRKIFEGRDDFIRSYRLVSLYPQWVNQMDDPLVWLPGFVRGRVADSRLAPYSASIRLVTADNWEAFKVWAPAKIAELDWYSLDIETSTPEESDDWLFAQGKEDGVDVMGSELTGMSLTFGNNMQFTVYISVDHADTANVSKEALRDWLATIPQKQQVVIHNTAFEGPVLYNEFGKAWKDNGYQGFLPNWLDTKFEASYVDENNGLGLKYLSKRWFDYDQVDYKAITTLEVPVGEPCAGSFVGTFRLVITEAVYAESTVTTDELGNEVTTQGALISPEVSVEVDRYKCKMRELSAKQVLDYACDDTATTAGLHNFFKFFMEIEGTYGVYLDVEIAASYLHAQSFVTGVDVDLVKLQKLVVEDGKVFDDNKVVVDKYLVEKGADGTVCPVYTEVTAAAIKYAYSLATGEELKTAVRTPAKLIAMFADSYPTLAGACTDVGSLNALVKTLFKGAPTLNTGSPLQLQKLFYTTMELPIRVFNKPTEKMREAGLRTGTPKTDNLAIAYALKECEPEVGEVLKSLRLMKMVETRRGLYYNTYGNFVHWKTGRVHSSHNQCATNTRRASSSSPNLQQMSKTAKVEGFSPRVRELLVPHKKKAVIVSFDFMSQEILLMAEWSKDPVMRELFEGDDPKDMHSITGCGIYNSVTNSCLDYLEFKALVTNEDDPRHTKVKQCRALGKAVNFGSQYRIAAKKLSSMLFVTEDDAQVMLDAKAEAFPVAEAWAQNEMRTVKLTGYVTTMLGAIRHLAPALTSGDNIKAGKAERQALSTLIQGSAAEMTKLAEGRMFKARISEKYDCTVIGAVHDECVFSVTLVDLHRFLVEVHALMTANYANMILPIRSSISFGPDFGQQFEAGDDPTGPGVEKALAKYYRLMEELMKEPEPA